MSEVHAAPQKTLSERITDVEARLELALKNASVIPTLWQQVTALRGEVAALQSTASEIEASAEYNNTFLAAILGALAAKKVVDLEDIKSRIRQNDDASANDRLNAMVQSGLLVASDEATAESVVSLQVTEIESSTGQVELLRENLLTPVKTSPLAANLVGKKVGDSISTQVSETVSHVTTIAAIYNEAQQKQA